MAYDYAGFVEAIAHFIGTPAPRFDNNTAAAVERCIQRAMENVIHNGQHQWSWMRPKWQWKTASGQRRYTLPLDFEQFIPNQIYFDGNDSEYGTIQQRPASRLMRLQTGSVDTGTPCRFAIETVAHDGASEQQQQLVLHPTPDNEYSLVAIYQIGVRGGLSDTRPYPPGGPAHGELFLSACLAATEAEFRDGELEKKARFQETLINHIAIDLRNAPRNLGQMGGHRRARLRGRSDARMIYDLSSGFTTYSGGTDV